MDSNLKIRLGDLNFVESLREQTRAAGGEIMEREGLILMRGSHPHPLHNNVVRLDPQLAPSRCIELAHAYYGELGYGFIVALLNGQPSDDLAESCEQAGLSALLAPPAMFVERRLPDADLPAGCELRQVDASAVRDFVDVSCLAWATYGIPGAAVSMIFADADLFGAPHVRAILGYRAGQPLAAALLLLTHGIGGVYWVGTVPSARGTGLGEACTRAATNLAFDAGVPLVTLQASPMGEPIYRRMGFESLGAYRLFVHAGSDG